MQELLARLKSLDSNASLALRVIACFDELVRGGVNSQALLGAAAALSGCVAGYERTGSTSVLRVSPNGEHAGPAGAKRSLLLELDDAQVWLEREGPPHANDAIILERLALAIAIRHGQRVDDPLRRLGALLDPDLDAHQRRDAGVRMGLSARARYRVVTLPLFATWDDHPDMQEDVVSTACGPIHVGVVPADVTHLEARPCGIGAAMGLDALHRSFATALVSLRLCAPPAIPLVVADDYGGLVELLAQYSLDQPLLDVEELETVMRHPWASATLDALLRSSSVRQAARLAEVHHSTMQTRLETIRDDLPFDPMDGLGRTRIGLAFLAWRLRHSTVLALPPGASRIAGGASGHAGGDEPPIGGASSRR